MNVMLSGRLRFVVGLALAGWIGGCARSPSSHFYTVTPLAPKVVQRPSSEVVSKGVTVKVFPVEIPDYLERPQIVTREGSNTLKMAEFHRWGGSLRHNLSAVLAENLGMLLGSDRVFVQGDVGGEKPEFLVAIQLLHLDARPGDRVAVKARWFVARGGEKANVTTQVTTFSTKLPNSDYETLVSGVSETLGQLSRVIAQEIRQRAAVPTTTPTP